MVSGSPKPQSTPHVPGTQWHQFSLHIPRPEQLWLREEREGGRGVSEGERVREWRGTACMRVLLLLLAAAAALAYTQYVLTIGLSLCPGPYSHSLPYQPGLQWQTSNVPRRHHGITRV